jgi:AbrB family looped-hinge helix DNA binding protein
MTSITNGMIHTMITTMDPAGRLVIPSEIRREAALVPGAPLEVRWRDGVIEIEPQPLAVKLVRKRHLLVAHPAVKVAPLRKTTVERTRREMRRGRG